ncbi:MAG: hypothetical protein V3V08_00555 [Nannocystaceae bacterium]
MKAPDHTTSSASAVLTIALLLAPPACSRSVDAPRENPSHTEHGNSLNDRDPAVDSDPFLVVHRLSGGVQYGLFESMMAQRRGSQPAERESTATQILSRLSYQKLLADEAQQAGVNCDPAKVEAELATVRNHAGDWSKHLQRIGETQESYEGLICSRLRETALASRNLAVITDKQLGALDAEVKENYRSPKVRLSASQIFIGVEAPDSSSGPQDRDWRRAQDKAQSIRAPK